jgi:phosphoribosylglycinamide formyltransferase 1
MSEKPRLAVLISGTGSTLQNFLDRTADGRLGATVVHVVSNRADAFGLERAKTAGVGTTVVERKACASREEFSQRIFAACREAKADLVCMAGFLQLVIIPDDFTSKVLNIHPSLIPAFCGKGFHGRHVHEAVLASGVRVTGCTVHFADNLYDNGPIVVQKTCPVLDDDTVESLTARVGELEREAYPEAIRLVSSGGWRIEGRRVKFATPSPVGE